MGSKLLLADDSITIQKVVELVLADEGFEIKAVNNGEEALHVIRSFKPDIVLADIDMPKINGYQLCEKIKTHSETKDIPVILLSGAFEPVDEDLVKQVKADGYIIKPFESQELLNKINSTINPSSKQSSAASTEEPLTAAEAANIDESDLWTAEAIEVVPEIQNIKRSSEEEPIGVYDISDDNDINLNEAIEAAEEISIEPVAPVFEKAQEKKPVYSNKQLKKSEEVFDMAQPSKDEVLSAMKSIINEKVSESFSKMNIKEIVSSSISDILKNNIEKILWDIAPEIIEKNIKGSLQNSLASLNTEIEKIIWETVPEIAETMISGEIKKIKSEK
jgi:DNA-binding response OmpR family regulator